MTVSPIAWADPARADAFACWLAAMARQHPMQADTVRLASADASFRRYFRVDAAGGTNAEPGTGSYIIMDAPPAQEDCRPFVKVAGLMQDAGLNAPRVLAWDEPLGFMLLSDLGAQTLLDVIAPPSEVDAIAQPAAAHHDLYMDAVDALVRWQLASRPGVLPPYDEALLSRELALFPDWYVARHRGIALDAGLQGKLEGLFAQIKASNLQSLGGARVYVHRDFMPRNLMLGKNGDLGVLDFQDAVYGPITYDIASLMRDAFLSWEEEFVLDITVRYWQKARKAGLPVGDDFGEFYRA
ncbi:MAG: aminoglycoside phosphotransferase family protein, partial [Polaromonas sp.]